MAYWSNALKFTRPMVANDGVAADDMRKAVLGMAAPAGVRTSIIPDERVVRQIMERELLDRGIDIIMQVVPQGAVTHLSDCLNRTAS